jgi:hypothetical protein
VAVDHGSSQWLRLRYGCSLDVPPWQTRRDPDPLAWQCWANRAPDSTTTKSSSIATKLWFPAIYCTTLCHSSDNFCAKRHAVRQQLTEVQRSVQCTDRIVLATNRHRQLQVDGSTGPALPRQHFVLLCQLDSPAEQHLCRRLDTAQTIHERSHIQLALEHRLLSPARGHGEHHLT